MNSDAIQRDRARYMSPTHRRAIEAALHVARTAGNIAALLDEDRAPEEPKLQNVEHWIAVIDGEASTLRGEIKGLRHEYGLRRTGQL